MLRNLGNLPEKKAFDDKLSAFKMEIISFWLMVES